MNAHQTLVVDTLKNYPGVKVNWGKHPTERAYAARADTDEIWVPRTHSAIDALDFSHELAHVVIVNPKDRRITREAEALELGSVAPARRLPGFMLEAGGALPDLRGVRGARSWVSLDPHQRRLPDQGGDQGPNQEVGPGFTDRASRSGRARPPEGHPRRPR